MDGKTSRNALLLLHRTVQPLGLIQEAETANDRGNIESPHLGHGGHSMVSAVLLAAGDGGMLRAEHAAAAPAGPSAATPANGTASVRNAAAMAAGPAHLRH